MTNDIPLISSWYTDASVALPRDKAVRLGHHRFEQFVRCDVRLAVKNQHVRTRFSHTTVAMLLLVLAPSFLDVIASPETSLPHAGAASTPSRSARAACSGRCSEWGRRYRGHAITHHLTYGKGLQIGSGLRLRLLGLVSVFRLRRRG